MNFRSRFFPVKSWIGEISANSSPSPSSQNHLKESICVWIRFGSGRTSGSDAKLRRARTDAGTRSRVTDMGDPSSGLMAGQVDRRRGLYLWQGQYRIPDPAARSTVGTAHFRQAAMSCQGGSFAWWLGRSELDYGSFRWPKSGSGRPKPSLRGGGPPGLRPVPHRAGALGLPSPLSHILHFYRPDHSSMEKRIFEALGGECEIY